MSDNPLLALLLFQAIRCNLILALAHFELG